MWLMTHDTWHVTRDTWHVTRDTWHMTHSVEWTFSQNFSSLALAVWDWQCFEYISTNHHLHCYWINDKAVCRTAPITPGLLITLRIVHESPLTSVVYPKPPKHPRSPESPSSWKWSKPQKSHSAKMAMAFIFQIWSSF